MANTISDFLSPEEIDSIRRPIEQALTLPAHAYVDADFYQLEIEKIYQQNWVAVLFASEICNPGDIKPFEICEIPLLAIHGDDGQIRIFHNICPYDGCLVAINADANCVEIVTPYHGWIYSLEGKLTKTPYWDGTQEGDLQALKGKKVDLIPVNVEVFLNTVFMNLSETPVSFTDYVAPVVRAMNEYDLTNCRPGIDEDGNVYHSRTYVQTNWKTYFENACLNVLHENFVHELYRASSEVPRIKGDGIASFKNIIDEKFMALGYNRLDFQKTYPPVDAPHLGVNKDHEPEQETFGTLYPNFYVSASSQFIETGIVLPKGPDKVESNVCYHFQRKVATSEEALPARKAVAGGFYGAALEDAKITEAIQKARKSPVYQQKFYAPFWDAMHHYLNQLILTDLEESVNKNHPLSDKMTSSI